MTNKNLAILVGVAIVLGGAAYFLGGSGKTGVPHLNGKRVFPNLAVSDVASIEVGTKLKVSSTTNGWAVDTFRGYPAAREKITENLLKLAELKVGQVARGKKIEKANDLVLRDAAGKEIVRLPLGEKHAKWGHGRYAAFANETVLLSDGLDAFEGDGKQWLETKIVDDPWISFNDLADAKLTDAEMGFSTGIVAKVTIAGNTNRVMTIGGVVKGGSDRYIKLDGSKWVYTVSSYSVDKFLPKPPPKEEKKTEPAKATAKATPAKANK